VTDSPAGDVPTVFEGIVRQRCLAATYNRTEVTLAPHIIYTRHGDLFIDGVVLERDGRPPKELKLGTFKLAGLNDIEVTDRSFQPDKIFNANDIKYEGVTLFVV
jgi:hypothetical protein